MCGGLRSVCRARGEISEHVGSCQAQHELGAFLGSLLSGLTNVKPALAVSFLLEKLGSLMGDQQIKGQNTADTADT